MDQTTFNNLMHRWVFGDPAAAAVGHIESAQVVLRQALESLKDGGITPDEHLRIASACAQCVAMIETINQIAAGMAPPRRKARAVG